MLQKIKELAQNNPVIIDFYAEWCGPCKMFKPKFDKMKEKYDNVTFLKIDVDKYPDVAGYFNIMSIPSVIFLKDGDFIDSLNGNVHEDVFENKIKQLC